MKIPIETHTTRLMPKHPGFVLQNRRTFLGVRYWATVKRYKTLDEFNENDKK